MNLRNPIDNFKRFEETFKPDPDKVYFVHADLAQKHDKCAVAIAHVYRWVNVQVIKDYEQIVPIVVVDAVVWWEPRAEGPVNLSDVKQWIMNLRRQGFNLGMVSFDRWQSFDIQNELQAVGIRTETISVAKKHYEDLAMMIYEERVAIPRIPLLLDEMSELKIMKGNRVDHPRKKSKDLADAMCGAVFGAISHTPKNTNLIVDVHTWSSASKLAEQKRSMVELDTRQKMPEDVKDFLGGLNLI
jgi:phage terminase large subunit-like protein